MMSVETSCSSMWVLGDKQTWLVMLPPESVWCVEQLLELLLRAVYARLKAGRSQSICCHCRRVLREGVEGQSPVGHLTWG